MPQHRDDEHRPPPRQRIECEIRNGLPTILGKANGHYVMGQNGRQMLIVERRPGERMRINATTELEILEVGPEVIRIAIEVVAEEEKP